MDVLSRTFFAATAAGPATARHIAVFRRCVESDDAAVILARCVRPERPMAGDFLLLLTRRRLVVTQETRVLHRLRLHLNANLRHLSDVTWNVDERQTGIEVAATAVDGVRERFWMKLGGPEQVWQADALLKNVFHERSGRRMETLAGVAA
jgi:hypothetical protein